MKNRKGNPKGVNTRGLPILSAEQLRANHAESQRKYRQKLKDEGFMRVEIFISPELWAKMRPYLDQYKGYGGLQPGRAIVDFLSDLSY